MPGWSPLPLLGALTAAAGGRWLRQQAHWPVVVGIGLSCLVSLGLLTASAPGNDDGRFQLARYHRLHVPVEFRVDGLTTMMLAMVTFVSTLVAIYAVGYMAGEPGYPRFFAVVGLFVASMTGLVLSNNYLLTYVFWEGVGTCSYLLVGFWYQKPAAAAAAKKAFLVNRVGDVGFATAIFWMWSVVPDHDLSYGNVLSEGTLTALPHATIAGDRAPALLGGDGQERPASALRLAARRDGRSDARLGPDPRRDDGHGRRLPDRAVDAPDRPCAGVQLVIAVTGCATALLSASIALTQTDLKRVMAYSTVSQLGYMFMALGAGIGNVAQLAVVAAMFHLFTHAFFKALLFLASGSVMHAMGGVIDMRRFSGLRHKMPYTCWTFLAGGLALSGIFRSLASSARTRS